MRITRTLALGGAVAALFLIGATVALAAGTTVSVRVEGLSRTLLAATNVHTQRGSITKGGTPAGVCPSTTAAGALDVATHHRWNGSYSTTQGLSVTQILGETHTFTSPDYWSIWVDNRFASAGVCGLKLHQGEHLLFAAVSDKGNPLPIGLSGPAQATAGRAFKVKVVYYNGKGGSKPLAGAHVGGAVSDKNGFATVHASKAGKLELTASEKGHIRSASVTVRVSG